MVWKNNFEAVFMKRFSDFAKSHTSLSGDKVRIDEILGKEIEVMAFILANSKYKEGTKVLKLQFRIDGEVKVLFTGSKVLIEQATEHEDEIPFMAKIEKVNNKYYTFT